LQGGELTAWLAKAKQCLGRLRPILGSECHCFGHDVCDLLLSPKQPLALDIDTVGLELSPESFGTMDWRTFTKAPKPSDSKARHTASYQPSFQKLMAQQGRPGVSTKRILWRQKGWK